jgi:amino acid transporter
MLKDIIRVLLVVILIFVILVDFDLPIIISTPINQLFIAIIVLFLILTVDEIIGFLTGLIFLVIYFKYYQRKLNKPATKTAEQHKEAVASSPLGLSFDTISHFTSTPAPYTTSQPEQSTMSSIFKFFSGDTKPKEYSNQPEIPDHYVEENKNDNSKLVPYISNDLLKAAQNNIFDEKSYNTEIKQDKNSYGIQGLNSDNTHFEAFDNSQHTYTHL